ncbi:polysaccharide deacetylase family protein [Pontimicrobium sp. IMCC45349]|uniref:polysaccharide deacetylase family protein n=1 Tax=Pontimicrobium sp. IMCC45349 TaxID=3391574 RepID=UPI00399EED8D
MKKLASHIIKELIGFGFRIFGVFYLIKQFSKKNKLYYVFNYHNFSKYNNYKLKRGNILETGYEESFEKQIKFFNKHFKFSYPSEFFKSTAKECSVLVTFDDGYKDNYNIALPILKKYDAKAFFFIVTSLTGTRDMLMHDKIRLLVQLNKVDKSFESIPRYLYKGTKNYDKDSIDYISKVYDEINLDEVRMMNNEDLEGIVNNGFKLGNHTHNHQGLSFLTESEQLSEMEKCDTILREITNVNTIAYPNGLYNSETIALCKTLNYDYGFTILPGVNDKGTNHLELKRIGVNASDSLNVIVFKIIMNYFGVSWI